ncbi:MAG: hypothetical protein KAH84_05655 [Thiomargarita sp.]|nr:hypothetical protein [Thiomargarita sp.]
MENLRKYLENCRELSELTSQNGWIDNESLEIEIIEQEQNTVTLKVIFKELIMEGAGCLANRLECFGKVQLQLDENGKVVDMKIL